MKDEEITDLAVAAKMLLWYAQLMRQNGDNDRADTTVQAVERIDAIISARLEARKLYLTSKTCNRQQNSNGFKGTEDAA